VVGSTVAHRFRTVEATTFKPYSDTIAFRKKSISIPTKTIIKAVQLSGHFVRGYDSFKNKQNYKWTKFLGRYRNWKIIGKITAPLQHILQAFWAWFAYYRLYGTFDLDAVLEGERPP